MTKSTEQMYMYYHIHSIISKIKQIIIVDYNDYNTIDIIINIIADCLNSNYKETLYNRMTSILEDLRIYIKADYNEETMKVVYYIIAIDLISFCSKKGIIVNYDL